MEAFGGCGWGGDASQGTKSDTISTKGIKAKAFVNVTGGTVRIDSCDDSIQRSAAVCISGGMIQASPGDDGVHADALLQISGGKVTIARGYEELEAASVEITGVEIEVQASDDGINEVGGSDGSQEGVDLAVSGGLLHVDASGDGLD